MNAKKMGLILVTANAVFFIAIIVFLAYAYYPLFWGGRYRISYLKKIYNELTKYEKETGGFPGNLNSLVRYDPNGQKLFFGSEQLWCYYPFDSNNPDLDKFIHFQVINSKPVLLDLGQDATEGGLEDSIDVAYPLEYQRFPFTTFMTTKCFWVACLWGLFISASVSIPMYLRWRKSPPTPAKSIWDIIFASILLILFVLFEIVIAYFIIGMHVYPHH